VVDAHTTKLRYFVVLAEELHFRRAAARLHITQQALSRHLRDLERQVGVTLVERTTRSVELTEAGRVFLESTRAALGAFDTGVTDARRAALGSGLLRVGVGVGAALELTPLIMDAFRERYPSIEVEVREFPHDSRRGLSGDWADVALVRLPITADDLRFEPLFTEPLVLAVPSHNALAQQDVVTVEDVLDLPITSASDGDPAHRAFWTLQAHRHDPAQIVPVSSLTEEVTVVLAEQAVMLTAAAQARYLPNPGLTYVPVAGVEGSTVAVAWRRSTTDAQVAVFVEVARAVRDASSELIRSLETPPRAVT